MPAPACSAAIASSISRMIDGWMPSVGSSSTSSLGRVTSARAMASCCACPPLSRPAGRLQQLPQRAGTRRGRRRSPRGHRALTRSCTTLQVLGDGQLREHLVALRHVADPGAGTLVGGQLGDVAAVEQHRARPHGEHAHHRVQQRGLADAVAPHQAHEVVVGDLERDAEQHLGAAVRDAQVLDRRASWCDRLELHRPRRCARRAIDRGRPPAPWVGLHLARPSLRRAPCPRAARSPGARSGAGTPCRAR